jgi:hypothetical protein
MICNLISRTWTVEQEICTIINNDGAFTISVQMKCGIINTLKQSPLLGELRPPDKFNFVPETFWNIQHFWWTCGFRTNFSSRQKPSESFNNPWRCYDLTSNPILYLELSGALNTCETFQPQTNPNPYQETSETFDISGGSYKPQIKPTLYQ